MTDTLFALIKLLADGRFHSGEELGRALGISRAAVWKALKMLPQWGLEMHAVNGRGYRLAETIELLDKGLIESHLTQSLHLLASIDSTNLYLNQLADSGARSGTVCLAEAQTDGRGRRGRAWHSPFGTNIYLSVLWRFNGGMSTLGGLSLAVAVALMRSFKQAGAKRLGIKWPNDIVCNSGKVAGILVDVAGESTGPCHAVIGIGVNYGMRKTDINTIDQPWATLKEAGCTFGRNEMVVALLHHLFAILQQYEGGGFEMIRAEWMQSDSLRDQKVDLILANGKVSGIARGCDSNGLLLLERDGEIHRYAAGEVSLRRMDS